MTFQSRSLLLLAILTVAGSAPARADENHLFTPDYFRRVGRDVLSLPGTIGHWSPAQWAAAGGIGLATWGAYTYDGEARENFGHQRPKDMLNDFSRSYTHFGDYRLLVPIIGATWITGMATGSETLSKIAGDATEATFISAGVINPGLALATGRALPSAGENPDRFRPFTRGRYSFPSGHTSAAFAVASVIDVNLRGSFGYWQTPVVYSVAALVGESRVYDHKHYPSEIILGAAIGASVGHWVASRPRNAPASMMTVSVSPNGIRFAWAFGPGEIPLEGQRRL